MAVDYATLKKGGFMRQKQKNNFSLRLRVVGGNLTAKQLATIAEVSDKYGEGYVHLTSRQSVEINRHLVFFWTFDLSYSLHHGTNVLIGIPLLHHHF